MSNPSSSSKQDVPRNAHLQQESVPFALHSPQQLAQFAAANAQNYYPKQQTQSLGNSGGSGFNSMTTNTSQKGSMPTNPSEFTASAIQAAQNAANGLQPPPAQPIDLRTFTGLKFVTLDGLQIETRDVYDKISGTFQWEMCESQEDHCIAFIRDKCADKRVFLITSGSLGRKCVPAIHDSPQIYAIYVYCADVVYNQEWANKFKKVRVVCNDDDKYLLPQLAVDVAQANMEWGDALVKEGKRDEAKKKYQKALENLNEYAKRPDPAMVTKVKAKLEENK